MAVFTALAIASLAVSVYGQVKAGRAAKKAGELQQDAANSEAALTDYNAGTAAVQATDATQRGELDEQRFRMGVRGMVGQQRAAAAANNIDVNFGSARDVQADATELGEYDALTIRTNAAREAWGFNVQAEDLHQRAAIVRKEGVNAKAAGKSAATSAYIGAAGTVLGGTANLMQSRYGMRNH